MPFDKVEQQVDFPAQERAVLKFWQESGAFEELVKKNQAGPRWSFLDGPITANNPMGVHHAWGRTYFTMSDENNYTIWQFLKKCHARGLVYRAYDAMPWCPRCSVGLSQMEMAEGYQMVAHRAVFVAFPLRGRPGENLLVWTTTPWTLTSNVAAAVHPYLTYLKVRHKGQVYYLAKGALTAHRLEEQFRRKEWVPGVPRLKTLEQVFKEKGGYAVEGSLSGAEMVGWTYDGPFDDLPAEQH